jgi:hypothetical protein
MIETPNDSADRPAPTKPGIKVTPQMIAAGVEVYLGYCPDTGAGDATDRAMVVEMFAAMAAKQEASSGL